MENSAMSANKEPEKKKNGSWRRGALKKATKFAYSAWVFLKTVAAIDDAMKES